MFKSLVTLSLAAAASAAGLNGYWGQAGTESLKEYCDSGVEYVTLSFLNTSPENDPSGYPGTNFAGHCWAGVYSNDKGVQSKLLSECQSIKEAIPYCKERGVKVLLSIGGVYNEQSSNYKISTPAKAVEFANFIQGAFGPYKATWDGPRPFDLSPTEHTSVDGYDIDIEHEMDNVPWIALINRLRVLQPSIIITGAPQCPTNDPYFVMKDLIQQAAFDAFFIQFYNNPGCDAIDDADISWDKFNYDEWEGIVAASSKSKNAKIYVGIPSSLSAAGSGYITPVQLKNLVCSLQKKPHFGGISLWDLTRGAANVIGGKSYNQHALDALKYGCNPIPVSSSTTTRRTTSTISTRSSTSTKASTTTTSTTLKTSTTSKASSSSATSTVVSSTTSKASSSSVTSTVKSSTTEASSSTSEASSSSATSSVESSTTEVSSSESSSVISSTFSNNSTTTSATSTDSSSTGSGSASATGSTTLISSTETESSSSSAISSFSHTGGWNSTITTKATITETATDSVSLTTSTVYTTTVYTVTKCPPDVPNCPGGVHVITKTIPLYTTVCPVTETGKEHKPTTTPAPKDEIKTIYTTKIYTITACPPYVHDCPVGKVTTEVAPWTTTVVRVTDYQTVKVVKPTDEVPAPPSNGGGDDKGCGENCVVVVDQGKTTTLEATSTIYRTVVVPPATLQTYTRPAAFTPQPKPHGGEGETPSGDKPGKEQPGSDKPSGEKPSGDKPGKEQPGNEHPSGVAKPTGTSVPGGCTGPSCPAPTTVVPVTAGASALSMGVAGLVAMVAFQLFAL